MDKNDESRFHFRIPKKLKKSLKTAVANGSSDSITAEIIKRLEKSLETQPVNPGNPFSTIRQLTAKIQETIIRAEATPPVSRQAAIESFSAMDKDDEDDEGRFNLRFPKELKDSLKIAVANGSSGTITAEIIKRLEKSLETHPADPDNPFSTIRQLTAKIQETAIRAEAKPPVSRKAAIKSLYAHEQGLLKALDSLPNKEQKPMVKSLLPIISKLKPK